MIDTKDLKTGWKIEDNWLVKRLELDNFKEVIELVNDIAKVAEEANHHPDLRIYSYKNLEIKLQSHDAGEVTQRDLDLAKKIDELT